MELFNLFCVLSYTFKTIDMPFVKLSFDQLFHFVNKDDNNIVAFVDLIGSYLVIQTQTDQKCFNLIGTIKDKRLLLKAETLIFELSYIVTSADT